MNLNEAASLLGVSKERAIMAIESGIETPRSRTRVRLSAVSLPHGYDVAQEDLDHFISTMEREEPGRHPPVAIRRLLLIESGYKCAVCRDSGPLEFHHIIEWATIKHHDPEHMLALCANCHGKITRYGEPDVSSQKLIKRRLAEIGRTVTPLLAIADGAPAESPERSSAAFGFDPGAPPPGDTAPGLGASASEVDQLRSLLAGTPTLRSSLTRRRWEQVVRHATPAVVRTWLRDLGPLVRFEGTIEAMVVAMWEAAQEQGLVPHLVALDGHVDMTALTELYLEKKALWRIEPDNAPKRIGPNLFAHEAHCGWAVGAWAPSHSLAGPLFEMTWEALKTRQNDAAAIDTSSLRWWTPAGGSWDAASVVLFPWPTVDLPGFTEYERMLKNWNRECSRAIAVSQHLPKDYAAADDLAYSHVDYLHARALSHSEAWTHDWKWLINHLQDELASIRATERPTPKLLACARWIGSLPLFAAPESGLSPATATTILRAARLDDRRRVELRELRLQRIRTFLPHENPDAVAARLDQTHPDHPWTKELGQR